jgi:hypothetical protein
MRLVVADYNMEMTTVEKQANFAKRNAIIKAEEEYFKK